MTNNPWLWKHAVAAALDGNILTVGFSLSQEACETRPLLWSAGFEPRFRLQCLGILVSVGLWIIAVFGQASMLGSVCALIVVALFQNFRRFGFRKNRRFGLFVLRGFEQESIVSFSAPAWVNAPSSLRSNTDLVFTGEPLISWPGDMSCSSNESPFRFGPKLDDEWTTQPLE